MRLFAGKTAGAGPRLPRFTQCPGCTFDFLTGEGTRACGWYDCPYLPVEYDVFCPNCRFNFASGDGSRRCDGFSRCDWAAEGFRHAELARARFGATP